MRHLVFSHVPCSSSGPAACAAFPAAGSLRVFWSLGVCPSASLVTWVGLQPFPSFSGLLLRLLAGVVGVCTLCQGAPVAVMSAWFAGEVTLLPFPYLRVGVFLAYGVSGVCGLRSRSRLPFVVRHPFLVSVGPSPFLGLGWLGHRFVAPPATPGILDSSDTRLRRPGALASGHTLSFCRRGSLPWPFARTWVSRPRPCLGSSLPLPWV